ncbi:MAG TPA: SMI1/KNR4 family protein [Clostridia bacterium]|nr:SMI1/KNR4 family protein [Clostridia bacterium]
MKLPQLFGRTLLNWPSVISAALLSEMEKTEFMLDQMLQPNPPINESQLLAFGARYHIDLPLAYRNFLLKYNGGQPVPAAFPIEGLPDNPAGVIQAFFGLNASLPTEDLDTIMTELADRMPKGILPIACTDGNDFVCFDLREGDPVVFWDRKPFWGSNVWNDDDLYPVASNFELLLNEKAT